MAIGKKMLLYDTLVLPGQYNCASTCNPIISELLRCFCCCTRNTFITMLLTSQVNRFKNQTT